MARSSGERRLRLSKASNLALYTGATAQSGNWAAGAIAYLGQYQPSREARLSRGAGKPPTANGSIRVPGVLQPCMDEWRPEHRGIATTAHW